MKCLVVIAHPLADSLCHSMAKLVITHLTKAGHEVIVEDLYQENFTPMLSSLERESYYSSAFNAVAVQQQLQNVTMTEAVVLVFPTWWFGFPAILKGWFDRVWAPGIAYDHASDLGAIQPKLTRLKKTLVITSLGSPWWVDYFILQQPVKRILKRAILGTCAPKTQFDMLSLYKAEKLSAEQIAAFGKRIEKALAKW